MLVRLSTYLYLEVHNIHRQFPPEKVELTLLKMSDQPRERFNEKPGRLISSGDSLWFSNNMWYKIAAIYCVLFQSVKKVPDFFCENLVRFNEARLHEATLKLHMHA